MKLRWFPVAALVSVVVVPRLDAVQQPAGPCEQLESAVRADTADVAAALRLGQCAVRDEEMIAPGGDSARLAFRTTWNPALRALRRAVQVDATNARAYALIFRMLFAETRDGCSRAAGVCLHVASVIRDGDSLITVPHRVPEGVSISPYDSFIQATAERQGPSLDEAIALADRWLAVAPNDHRPHQYRGQALLRRGQFAAATEALERAAALGTAESRRRLFWERFEAFVKANRGVDARRLLDEAAADSGRDTTQLRGSTIASLNALVGRSWQPPVDSARARQARERLQRMLREQPAPTRAEPSIPALIASGDTAGARQALVRFDAMLTVPPGMVRSPRYDPMHLQSARFHLALGDTARAEATLADMERPFEDRLFRYTITLAYGSHPWTGEAWLLAGDLAVARGRPQDAARMYRRVVGLWGGADAGVQPVVDDARGKLAALSRR